MDAQHPPRVRIIYQRAHDRGEIDLERIPSDVLAMPFDLVRHDLIMDLKPLGPARILSIVDELFLPLVQNYQATGSSACTLSYSRNGMSIFVLLLYSGYASGKVAARFRSSTVPQ
jgi:Tetracyclin repressor-like, C-terminal domain